MRLFFLHKQAFPGYGKGLLVGGADLIHHGGGTVGGHIAKVLPLAFGAKGTENHRQRGTVGKGQGGAHIGRVQTVNAVVLRGGNGPLGLGLQIVKLGSITGLPFAS